MENCEVWKYKLVIGAQTVDMPPWSRVLSCGMQGDTICIWVQVVDQGTRRPRHILVVGTGHPFPADETDDMSFIGTVQDEMHFVWHVFAEAAD